MTATRDKLGVCEWFHLGDRDRLRRAAADMADCGVRHVRTGLSWADYHRPGGPAWFDEVLDALAPFDVLACLYNTPPSLSENKRVNGPPRNLDDYAAYVWTLCTEYRGRFAAIELWNEPNNGHYWDFAACDPGWRKFAGMIRSAAWTCRDQGVPCCLGGVAPADPAFVGLLRDMGTFEHSDAVGVHGFPGMWGDTYADASGQTGVVGGWDEPWRWQGWPERIRSISSVSDGRPIWVTETGCATHAAGEAEQCRRLRDAAAAPCGRVYWYGWQDLDPSRPAVEGFHVDEHEYHFGLVAHDGRPKAALAVLRDLL